MAQTPCSLPPASQIRTTRRRDNALRSWGRPPVDVLEMKKLLDLLASDGQ